MSALCYIKDEKTVKNGVDSICRHPLIYMWEPNWGSLRHKFGKKFMKEMVYIKKNTMSRYLREMVMQDDFPEQLERWLGSFEDERMYLLKKILFDIEMTDLEQFKEAVFAYGGHLSERNYVGRKLFEQMVQIIWQMEHNR